ncbi:hypothetical protein M9458_004395, partial [Cirrhinus mrigala]
DMVSFGGSEDDMLDSMSLAASDTEELSGSVNDSAPLPSADTNSPRTGTGMDAELFHPDPLEELAMDGERRAPGYGLQEEGGHNRCFQHGLGSSVRWQTSFRPLDESTRRDSHQLPRDAGSVSSPSLLLARSEETPYAGPLGQHDGGVLYRQGGLSSKRLLTLVEGLLEWAQLNLCSLRATHVPGRLNQGADMLSRSNVPSGEWTLHPQAVHKIWEVFGKAEVDLFASEDNSQCPMYYSKDRDALAHDWPNLLLYAFPPTQGTETQAPSGGPSLEKPALVLRAVPAARSSPLAHSPETGPPLSGERDNMAPPPQAVGPAPLVSGQESMNLSESVLNTISQARAPSTRRLYALKWSVFSALCSTRSEDPVSWDISLILSLLQELLDKGRSPSTLKICVATITASHAPIAGQSVGRNNLVVRFLKGSRRLNSPRPLTIPTWDLSVVLRALKGPPFEPLPGSDLRPLTFKAALLLALASVKHMGDLQALSVNPSCLEFGPGDSKVILKPRHGYVPKVPSTPFRAQVITLSALPSSEEDQELNLLCLVKVLRMYIERKGHPVTKQRLSRWIVHAIMLAYSSLGLQCPVGVRAHSTRGMASSLAWSSGVSIAEICAAASWASPSTFTRFYNLDFPALQARAASFLYDGTACMERVVSKGNVLGYCRNLGSLRYGNEYCVTGRAIRSNLRILWRNGRLYSRTAPPVLAGFGGTAAETLVCLVSLHNPMSVQFHCVIKKGFSQGEKRTFSHSV